MLATRWPRELPIATNSSIIDEDPRDARIAALLAELEKGYRDYAARGAVITEAEAEMARLHEQVEKLQARVRRLRRRAGERDA